MPYAIPCGAEARLSGLSLPDRIADAADWFCRRTSRPLPGTPANRHEFTTKHDLRAYRYQGDAGRLLRWLSSSGTVWDPLLFPWSEEDQRHADEGVRRAQEGRPGLEGQTALIVAPTGASAVGHHALRQVEVLGAAGVPVGTGDPAGILQCMALTKASVLFTLPMLAIRLSDACRERVEGGLRTVMLGGDVAAPARILAISRLSGAETIDYFGLSEVYGPVASQTRPGELLWTAPDVAVEVLDPNTREPCRSGQVGVLVLTTLWHKAMPLYRYWTDDYVRILPAAEGELRFATMGRPVNQIPLPNGGRIFLRDLDELVLGTAWAGREWRIRRDDDVYQLLVEGSGVGRAELRNLGEAASALGRWRVEAEATAVGSLPRDTPKLVYRE